MSNKKKSKKLNYYELMDRSSMMARTFEREIVALDVTVNNKKLLKQANKVLDHMFKLYQISSKVYFDLADKEN